MLGFFPPGLARLARKSFAVLSHFYPLIGAACLRLLLSKINLDLQGHLTFHGPGKEKV